MNTCVSALGTNALFPLVGFGLNGHRSAALVFLRMLCLGAYPLGGAGVVIGSLVAVALAAVFAYRALKTGSGPTLVYAGVSALGADALFPLVGFGLNGRRAAALIFLCVLGLGTYPLRGVGVVVGVSVAVALAAGIASCALSACRRAASVTVLDQNGLHTAESEAVRSLGIDYNSDGVEIRKIIRR